MDKLDEIFFSNEEDKNAPLKQPKVFPHARLIIALIIALSVIGALIIGIFIGQSTFSRKNDDLPIFDEIYEYLERYYYEDLTKEEMDELISKSLSGQLDPYTGLVSSTASVTLQAGIKFSIDTYYNVKTISAVTDNSPADGAGLKRGDVVIGLYYSDSEGEKYIDAKYLDSAYFSNFVSSLNAFKLKVKRGDTEIITPLIEKTYILGSNAEAYYLDTPTEGVGYIALASFVDSSDDFMAAMYEFENSGNNVLVLDLRDNGGGSTAELAKIIRNFIPRPSSKDLVLSIKGKENFGDTLADRYTLQEYDGMDLVFSKTNDYIGDAIKAKTGKDLKLVVVANDRTASASEAFIGNIKHYMDASDYAIIGESERTYGKGIAQADFPLKSTNKYTLHVTIGKYYVLGEKGTPQENELTNIHGEGYALDTTDITAEIKANILEESAIVKAMSIFANG